MLTLRRKGECPEARLHSVTLTKSHKTLHLATSTELGPVTAEESRLLEKLDLARLPRHVAVIMDGNGRWAQRKHLPRVAGHRSGTQTARTTIETCARLKIEALTLYAFSVENWRRPKRETDFLMQDMRAAVEKTAKNTGMVLCLALNYGGRAEIVDALNEIVAKRNEHNRNAPV